MGKKITPEIAREYQRRGAAARKANTPKRKAWREVVEAMLTRVIKSKNGEEKQVIDVFGEYMLNKAINEKDFQAIKYLIESVGEGGKQSLEVDAKLQTIEPITGIQILPCTFDNEEKQKKKTATKAKTTTKKATAKKT